MKLPSKRKYQLSGIFFRYLAGVVATFCLVLACLCLFFRKKSVAIALLLKSIRFNNNSMAIRILKNHINNVDQILYEMLGYESSLKEAATRTIVLSLPSVIDGHIRKGVLVVTFTTTFSFFIKHPQFQILNKYFVFVLEPSWAGYAVPEVLLLMLRVEHCLVQSSEAKDRVLINALFPEGVSTSFGASDWVNPAVFSPNGSPKKYDSIYVANLNPIKRAYRYIDAIARVKERVPAYRACLVCAGWGGAADDLKRYISFKGLDESIFFIPGLERKELVNVVNQSKVNILLSFKEGSNRSLFEAMFANVPVICIAENVGVNKSYINEFTGLLIPDDFLEDALVAVLDGWQSFEPRSWAMENISPIQTTKKLSKLLDCKFGGICNSGLVVKTNDPEVGYLHGKISSMEINVQIFAALTSGGEKAFLDTIAKLNLSPPCAFNDSHIADFQ